MEYDIKKLVLKYQDKNYAEILTELTKEVTHLDQLYAKLKRSEYDNGLTDYRTHAGDFLFFINSGAVPAGIGLSGLKLFLPIIVNLVDKGQLKPEVLNLFK